MTRREFFQLQLRGAADEWTIRNGLALKVCAHRDDRGERYVIQIYGHILDSRPLFEVSMLEEWEAVAKGTLRETLQERLEANLLWWKTGGVTD